jgi:enoyl-CoA hydratase
MTTVRRETIDPGITLVTLDRPDRLNAMSRELVRDLHNTLAAAGEDRECRVVMLTGAGRGFCAGLDLKETGDIARDVANGGGGPPAALRAQQQIASLVTRLRTLPKPVIAAVNGAATGGGLALALACDVRVAAESARFNVAFIRVGLSGCDIGVSYLLPRLVGASRAFELMLTGRMIDAAEADRIGLVSRVVPDGEVLDAARETAELIRANSPFGVWMTKEVMWSNLEAGSLQAAIDLENRTQLLSSYTGDMREALAAFVEKRPPQFSGR